MKLLTLLMCMLMSIVSHAQDQAPTTMTVQGREIKMPTERKEAWNIAENDKGYWCSIDLNGGSTLMEGRKNVALVALEFSNGYRFSQYLKIGAGLGVMYYPNNSNVRARSTHLAMPIFFNARGNMINDATRTVVPYWSINVGGSLPDGFFMTPTVGLRVGEKRNAFLVGLSYTLRQLDTQSYGNAYYSGAMLKLGYEF